MSKQRTYIFEVSGGWSIDGEGVNPKKAFNDAKKKLSKIERKKPHFISEPYGLPRELQPTGMFKTFGHLTGRYNSYGRDGLVETGSFPKKSILTINGKAKYLKTEIEDKFGKWNDNYYTKDGFYVIHKGKNHYVYQVTKLKEMI